MKSINTAVSQEFQTLAVLERIKYTYSVGTQQCCVLICVAANLESIETIPGLCC